MTEARTIWPVPTPEEAAAIVAALEVLETRAKHEPAPGKWEESGRLASVVSPRAARDLEAR